MVPIFNFEAQYAFVPMAFVHLIVFVYTGRLILRNIRTLEDSSNTDWASWMILVAGFMLDFILAVTVLLVPVLCDSISFWVNFFYAWMVFGIRVKNMYNICDLAKKKSWLSSPELWITVSLVTSFVVAWIGAAVHDQDAIECFAKSDYCYMPFSFAYCVIMFVITLVASCFELFFVPRDRVYLRYEIIVMDLVQLILQVIALSIYAKMQFSCKLDLIPYERFTMVFFAMSSLWVGIFPYLYVNHHVMKSALKRLRFWNNRTTKIGHGNVYVSVESEEEQEDQTQHQQQEDAHETTPIAIEFEEFHQQIIGKRDDILMRSKKIKTEFMGSQVKSVDHAFYMMAHLHWLAAKYNLESLIDLNRMIVQFTRRVYVQESNRDKHAKIFIETNIASLPDDDPWKQKFLEVIQESENSSSQAVDRLAGYLSLVCEQLVVMSIKNMARENRPGFEDGFPDEQITKILYEEDAL